MSMRRVVARMKQNNKRAAFVLQLTAMVDMFTIMIVFLLKSYSTSAVHIAPHHDLDLPYSTSYTQPVEALRLVVALDGIYVDDRRVIELEAGEIEKDLLDKNDSDFIRPLFEELDRHASRSRQIAEVNVEHEFGGSVVMQADSRLNYDILKKVMYTSSMAGYADMKLATMAP